jgi:hypothetical protein
MEEPDWMEAFACHPRIGERKAHATHTLQHGNRPRGHGRSSPKRSTRLQPNACLTELAQKAMQDLRAALRIHLYCVRYRERARKRCWRFSIAAWQLDRAAELREAAEQQRQITQIRLGKWLSGMSVITTHVSGRRAGQASRRHCRAPGNAGGWRRGWIVTHTEGGRAIRRQACCGRCARTVGHRFPVARPMPMDVAAIWRRILLTAAHLSADVFNTGRVPGSPWAAPASIRRFHHFHDATERRIITYRFCSATTVTQPIEEADDGKTGIENATENRACACRASRATEIITSSTSGPCASCSKASSRPASQRRTTARSCPQTR